MHLPLPIASLQTVPFSQPPLQTPQLFGCSKLCPAHFVPPDALSITLELGLCLLLTVFSSFAISAGSTARQSSLHCSWRSWLPPLRTDHHLSKEHLTQAKN